MGISKIKRLVVVTAIFFIALSKGFSQNTLGKVTIASPDAASLGKYVDIPVNYHTGIPSIGIPLYTVKEGSLELPISLSYHASGLKVNEYASSVGAGWALNAGGVITRTVRGAPDEKQSNSLQQKYGYFSDNGIMKYMFLADDGSGTPITNIHPNVVTAQAYISGFKDGEPDLFFFNFNGYSGKFYFNDDRTPILMPEQDLKIEYDYTGGLWYDGPGPWIGLGKNIEGFIITTPDGVKYYFGMTGCSPTAPNVKPIEVSSPSSANSGPTYSRSISSWYLNKIVSPDKNSTITLNYIKDSYAYYTFYGASNYSNTTSSFYSFDVVKNLVDGVKLNNISFSNGKVDFMPGPIREDLTNWWTNGIDVNIADNINQHATALGGIQITDNNNSAFCKKYAFNYSYFTDNTNPLPTLITTTIVNDKKRLKLDYLQEISCNNTSNIPAYHFEYFSEPVPRVISFGIDHWGYINGAANNDLIPSLTKNNLPYNPSYNAQRESAWPAMRAGTLNKVTYPTGGSTTYDFEPNTFLVNGVDKIVGGLRVKTIVQSDALDPLKNIVTSYNYNENTSTHSSAILYGKPLYIQKIRNDINYKTNSWLGITDYGCFPTTAPMFSRNTIQPMASTQGYHIGYAEVKVSKTNNGFIIYRYFGTNPWEVDHTTAAITNYNDFGSTNIYGACSPSIPNFPSVPLPNDFKRGELKYEGIYNESGQIINEKEFIPVYQESPVTVPGYIFVNLPTSSNSPPSLASFYELKTARKISNTSIERIYNIAGQPPIETTTQTLFESPNHHQATKTIVTNSLGQTIEKRINYAYDFIPTSISSITNCNYQNYANVISSFPINYQAQLNNCSTLFPNNDINTTVCRGNVWYNYLKDASNARLSYLSCRNTNYLNTTPLNTYQTNHDISKTAADATLKPILWMQDAGINAPIEISEWKNNKLISASYTQYSNDRDDASGIYPYKVMKLDVATSSSTFIPTAIATSGTSVLKDSRYTDAGQFDFNKGNIINALGRDAVNTAYQWGYNEKLPIVKIVNATNKIKESIQPSPVSGVFNFQIGSSSTSSGTLNKVFLQTQTGDITISIPSSLPPSARADATYTLTAPTAAYNKTGYLCASGAGGSSCTTTPSTITFSNMPIGQYTLSCSVNTTFPSYVFNYSFNYSYQGKAIISLGTKEFFFDGFEENTNSNVLTGTAKSGNKYYNTNYTVGFALPNARTYTIQWWNLVAGQWKFNQQAYIPNMVLTGPIDDVRIFPSDALMVTYTYNPLTGMTSETDPNGHSKYYEYDNFNRLSLIRDQDNNILKKICYNYAGQVEDCPLINSTTPRWVATGNTRCQPCAANSLYNNGVREREEKDINPNSPTYPNPPRWVIDPTGTCPSPANWVATGNIRCQSCAANPIYNSGVREKEEKDMNPCSSAGTGNTTRWVIDPTGTCPSPAVWQQRPDLASCETNATTGVNTGNQIIPVTDVNPCSGSFSTWGTSVIIANAAACPIGPPCNQACIAPQYKCINNVCVSGTWNVIASTKISKLPLPNGTWSCVSAWCFTDGTSSAYTETTTSTTACTVTGCP